MDGSPPPNAEAGPSRPPVYREHLPLPEAVIIRAGPSSSRRPLPSSQATHTPDTISEARGPRNTAPPKWDSYAAWREWNTNTVKHGPPELVNPPTFVPSSTEYDELGRSALHGVDVDVSLGKGKDRGEGWEDGERVADWYRSLSASAGPSRRSSPAPRKPHPDQSSTNASAPIVESESIQPDTSGAATNPTKPLLRVHRKEWFIRRALLTSHQRDSSSAPPPSKPPSSIGNLLNIPAQPKVTQAQYVLGPENRGYALLKDRLGWEGGGLGRGADWVPPSAVPPLPLPVPAVDTPLRATREVVIDENGVVDLTGLSSDDEAGTRPRVAVDEEDEEEVEVPGPGGPGRTAPIATTLKLDRLGLGHRRAAPRAHLGSTQKKVTHTAAEIQEAQRRSRIRPVAGVELGKKGKVKWKVKDQKEREERRRLAAALNA